MSGRRSVRAAEARSADSRARSARAIARRPRRQDVSASSGTIVRACRHDRRRRRIRVDPSLARGLSYYTGAIMEIAVSGSARQPWRRRRTLRQPDRHVSRPRRSARAASRSASSASSSSMTEREHVPGEGVAGGAVDVMVTLSERRRPGRRAGAGRRAAGASGLRVDVYPEADEARQAVQSTAAGRQRSVRGDRRRRRTAPANTVRDLQDLRSRTSGETPSRRRRHGAPPACYRARRRS